MICLTVTLLLRKIVLPIRATILRVRVRSRVRGSRRGHEREKEEGAKIEYAAAPSSGSPADAASSQPTAYSLRTTRYQAHQVKQLLAISIFLPSASQYHTHHPALCPYYPTSFRSASCEVQAGYQSILTRPFRGTTTNTRYSHE